MYGNEGLYKINQAASSSIILDRNLELFSTPDSQGIQCLIANCNIQLLRFAFRLLHSIFPPAKPQGSEATALPKN